MPTKAVLRLLAIPLLSIVIGAQRLHSGTGSSLSQVPDLEALAGVQTITDQQSPGDPTSPQLISLNTALVDIGKGQSMGVGPSSPPVPKKLADRIWKGKYIDLRELLPSWLGAPEPTVYDLFGETERVRFRRHLLDSTLCLTHSLLL